MSSWGHQLPSNRLSSNELFCKISKSGYGTNFQNFFMCYLYSRSLNRRLYLCDTTNNISESFHLILDTFGPLPGVVYTNKRGMTVFEDKVVPLNQYLSSLSNEVLYSQARSIFKFNLQTQARIHGILSKLPPVSVFDVGIHIRTGDKITSGEMKDIGLEPYIAAVNRIVNKKSNINVFLMTDNTSVVSRIQQPGWTVYTLPQVFLHSTGHDQLTFNRMAVGNKIDAYYHFLAELYTMQRCQQIVCTYSSNIGRFLYLTREPTVQIHSVDIPEFTFLHDMPIYLANAPLKHE